MKAELVLGIMSGTSMDGVDFALCSIDGRGVQLKRHWQADFSPRLRDRLNRAASNRSGSHELAQLHHDLGRFYAEQARKGVRGSRPCLAGLHGQTVFHYPDPPFPSTFQLGEAAYLVEVLNIPVVSNFRAADLAAGGQGAPLATLFHRMVFARPRRHVCVNNLGGISNVTSLDWRRGRQPKILAFDTGPANMLLDLAMRRLTHGEKHRDEGGIWAAQGTISDRLVARWLEEEYLLRRPPKSTGRELFGEVFLKRSWLEMKKAGLKPYDALATLTEFTARSLALNYKLHLGSIPDEVIVTGGGAANPTLVKRISHHLQRLDPGIAVISSESLGWPIQTIEAAAFALLAYYRWHRKPGNIPETTGARRAVLLGQLAEPWPKNSWSSFRLEQAED